MAEDALISPATHRDALRREMKSRRQALPVTEKLAAGAALAERLLSFQPIIEANTVAGYWSVGGEAPLHGVVPRLRGRTRFLLPRLSDDGLLRFAEWQAGDALVSNRYGIPEPDIALADCLAASQLDAVLVPLLAFDRQGHRLGMGAGWYDRTFAARQTGPAPPLLIGVGYGFQEVERLDPHEFDVALDWVVTESELFPCR